MHDPRRAVHARVFLQLHRNRQSRARVGARAMNRQLAGLLGQWHDWRRAYSHERGYARIRTPTAHEVDGDELDALLMRTMDEEIGDLPQEFQLALQHVARSECLGVEVVMNRMPSDRAKRQALCADAVARLERRLLALGLIG